MTRKILILDGHPDPANDRLVHALAAAYKEGAEQGQHEVHHVRLADLDFPILRTQADYESGTPVAAVRSCQSAMEWATHVVILFPLWLGAMPALLKALLEQILRPGFAFSTPALGHAPVRFLKGKTARIVVTMGMPALLYRLYFRSHSLRSLERNILGFVGFRRVRATVIGNVAGMDAVSRAKWLDQMRNLGRRGG
jgi:putative NADPH-quinone reductase